MTVRTYIALNKTRVMLENKAEAMRFLDKFSHIDAPKTLKITFDSRDARHKFTPVSAADYVKGNRAIHSTDIVPITISGVFPEKYLRSLMGK